MSAILAAMAAAAQSQADVSLTAQTISHGSEGAATAGIRLNADGTIDQNLGGSYSQIDASSDWIDPNDAATDAYEVEVTATGDTLHANSDATATWLDLGSAREWLIAASGTTKNAVLTVSIRKGSNTLATAVYTLEAEDFS